VRVEIGPFKRLSYSTPLSEGTQPLLNKLEKAVLIQSAGEFAAFGVYQLYSSMAVPFLFTDPLLRQFFDVPLIVFFAKFTQNLICCTGPVLYLTTNLSLRRRALKLMNVRRWLW